MIPYLVIITGGVIGFIVGGFLGLIVGLVGGFLLSNLVATLAFRRTPGRSVMGIFVRNALLAKAALPDATPTTRHTIEDRARAIYDGGGRWSNEGIADVDLQAKTEFVRYSFCAAAMMELGMEPPVPEEWNPPSRNPFNVPVTQEVIDAQSQDLRMRYGLSVTLEI